LFRLHGEMTDCLSQGQYVHYSPQEQREQNLQNLQNLQHSQ